MGHSLSSYYGDKRRYAERKSKGLCTMCGLRKSKERFKCKTCIRKETIRKHRYNKEYNEKFKFKKQENSTIL